MKKIVITITVLCLFCATIVVFSAGEDPLVSLSYLENVFYPKVKQYIGEQSTFRVINVAKGKTIIFEGGSEFILRAGNATAITTEKGGLADVTAGTDLPNGTKIPANHQLIVPLSDGRGFKANIDVIVMVKGNYTIK